MAESVLPVLQIDDYAEAVAFYVDGLGFEIVMEHRHEPNFPVFMIVKHGVLHLALSEHGRGHSGTEVYVYVDDISAWHERFVSGLSMDPEVQRMPWGNTEMFVTDVSRNGLRFCQTNTHVGENTPNR